MIQNCIELYLGLKTRKLLQCDINNFVHGAINDDYMVAMF